MEFEEAGNDLLGEVDVRLYLGDARVVVVGLGPRHRTGLVDLPGQRRAQLRVLREYVVEDRGSGTRLADDDDGTDDLLGGNLGILFTPIDYAQTIRQGANDVSIRDLDADRRK